MVFLSILLQIKQGRGIASMANDINVEKMSVLVFVSGPLEN